ncbi:MAG: vWA domain-containing protein [Pseudomonadota bacterium]
MVAVTNVADCILKCQFSRAYCGRGSILLVGDCTSMVHSRLTPIGVGFSVYLLAGAAFADSISPESFSADLAVGESATVRKTVVVEEGGPTDAKIDIHFLFDTSGSMGDEINAAQEAASDIFTALAAFGDVAGSVGVYAEAARLPSAPEGSSAPSLVVNQNLTTSVPTAIAGIEDVTLGDPDFGGDGPENGVNGIELATENLSWRPGSNRFMFVFGDIGFKSSDDSETGGDSGLSFDDFDNEDGLEISTAADAIAALDLFSVDLFGLDFTSGGGSFSDAIETLGGDAFESGTDPEDIVDAIVEGIVTGLGEYSEVTVGDLGDGLPEIQVTTVCVDADEGICDGALAVGEFDRSEDRSFEFDVTFTRVAEGDTAFNTFALVDGGIVAVEADSFGDDLPPPPPPVDVIPLPAAGWLLLAGLGGLGYMGRRRS